MRQRSGTGRKSSLPGRGRTGNLPVKPVGLSAISASSSTGAFDADAGAGGGDETVGAVGAGAPEVGAGVPALGAAGVFAGAAPYAQHPTEKARQRPVKRAQFSMFC